MINVLNIAKVSLKQLIQKLLSNDILKPWDSCKWLLEPRDVF